jgi:hypothetical protein
MKRLLLVAITSAVAAIAVAATLASMSRAADGPRGSAKSVDSSSGDWAPYPGAPTPDTGANSGVIQAGSCYYEQKTDDVHISSTAPKAVSVHAWWTVNHGTCPSTSNVDAFVQGYWCDVSGCQWLDVASNSKDVHRGGGSANWVPARMNCASTSKSVGFRGAVDVDLNGQSDPGGRNYSTPIDFFCVP